MPAVRRCDDCGVEYDPTLSDPVHRGDCPQLKPLNDFRNPSPDEVERRREAYLRQIRSRETRKDT